MSGRDWHAEPERLRDDLAAYALGALDQPDAADLELHLEACPRCQQQVAWLRPAVDALPASVAQLSPPDNLRENLLATVRAEAEPAASPAAPPRASRWQRLRPALLRPAVGLAAIALLVIGLATGYLLRGSGDEPARQLVSAEPLGPRAAEVSATLERHGDSATLHVSEMPALDRDQVYEVWVQRDGAVAPASTFVLGIDGKAEAAVPGPLDDAEAVLVTAEPRPGSRQPTTPPLLQAPL